MPPSARRSAPPAPPVIDYEKCIGCGICAQKCPRKLITVDGKVLESGHEIYDYAIEPNN